MPAGTSRVAGVKPSEASSGVAAVAGGFIYIVAKSTDKLFMPSMSVMIEHEDIECDSECIWVGEWEWICVCIIIGV